MEENYLEINQQLWNSKLPFHLDSDFYDLKGFLEGASSLKEIELAILGDVSGKSILHLQCHFGQDSISLARMGAEVVGVDLSDKAIEKAKELAKQTNANAHFICTDIYSLPAVLEAQFDIVFTSYGTIGWLPDMDRWAAVVAKYLKPNGRFVFVEFHPFIWAFDDDFSHIHYNYFNEKAIVETEIGTYAAPDAAIKEESIGWNHSLSEVMAALRAQGLNIVQFEEYDYSPYNCFKHTEADALGRFRIKHMGNKLPMVYSLIATKQ